MRIEINRSECPNAPATPKDCVRCVERFLTSPAGYETRCFYVISEPDSEEVNISIMPNVEVFETAPAIVGYGLYHSDTDWLG